METCQDPWLNQARISNIFEKKVKLCTSIKKQYLKIHEKNSTVTSELNLRLLRKRITQTSKSVIARWKNRNKILQKAVLIQSSIVILTRIQRRRRKCVTSRIVLWRHRLTEKEILISYHKYCFAIRTCLEKSKKYDDLYQLVVKDWRNKRKQIRLSESRTLFSRDRTQWVFFFHLGSISLTFYVQLLRT